MSLPSWLSKILVTMTSALLLIALVFGGIWLTRHPIPQGAFGPVALVAGLAAMVYGARKS